MEDAFAVSTARDMEVPVHVVVAKQAPVLDLAAWDHMVAFSIKAPSGRLAILGWVTPDAPSLIFRRCSLFSGKQALTEPSKRHDRDRSRKLGRKH